jgi:hypothetical protein
MPALSKGFFCDRSPGRGLVTTATNNSPPGDITVVVGEKKSGSASATTVVLVVNAAIGDTLLAWVYSHDDNVTSVSAASGVAGGFAARGGVGTHLKFFTGYVTATMTGVNVTATVSGTNGTSFIILPIRGAYNSTLGFFDPNAILPVTAGPNDSAGQHVQISTTHPRAMLVYACGAKGPLVNIGDPSGWIGIANTGFVLADLGAWYKLVNSAQTLLDVNPATSDAHETSSIGDGINGVVP